MTQTTASDRTQSADRQVFSINSRTAEAVARLRTDRAGLEHLYGAQLEEWARRQIAADPKERRSLILPHGTVSFRAVPASVRLADPTSALIWARQHRPDLVKRTTREDVDTAAYQEIAAAALQRTGEILPGCACSEARESFRITFGRKADRPA